MLGLFIVVTYGEQRLLVFQIQPGKRSYMAPTLVYVGYTTDCMAVRWRNHKSHIKNSIKSCELASHFISLSSTTHKLDGTSQATFTSELSEHIAIILLESVKPSPSLDVESFVKERENFWQGALKSTPLFGGINKRSNKHKKSLDLLADCCSHQSSFAFFFG